MGGFNHFWWHIEEAGAQEREVNILAIMDSISKANQELEFQVTELVNNNSFLVCYHLESCQYICSIKNTLDMKSLEL